MGALRKWMHRNERPFRAVRRVLLLPFILSACDLNIGGTQACTAILLPSLAIEVRDAATGLPAAAGVTGTSTHRSGINTDFAAVGDLTLRGDWQRELPGHHTISLRKPGFVQSSIPISASVPADECHVRTQTVVAEISRGNAERVEPLSFIGGPKINAWPPSATFQTLGDTLEINGFAAIRNCMENQAVAFRLGRGLHVQIEPSETLLDDCASPRRFRVRYLLPDEQTSLLVTNGNGFPINLIGAQVRPEPEEGEGE